MYSQSMRVGRGKGLEVIECSFNNKCCSAEAGNCCCLLIKILTCLDIVKSNTTPASYVGLHYIERKVNKSVYVETLCYATFPMTCCAEGGNQIKLGPDCSR